jgi:hypothetical protein
MSSMLGIALQRLRRRLGVVGVLGLLIGLAAVALAAWIPLGMRDSEALAARVAAAAVAPAAPARVRLNEGQQLTRFTEAFPTLSQNAEDLSRMFALAQKNSLKLPKGDYQLSSVPGSPFMTYTVTFPVKESYQLLKRYTSEVLSELPHASMDELRLERSDASARELDARIRFTLTYKGS